MKKPQKCSLEKLSRLCYNFQTMAVMDKNRKQKKVILGLCLAAAVFGLLFFIDQKSLAEDSDCGQLTGEDKDKCEELEKKAKAYRDLIEIKNKQQTTLQKQMTLIDTEQSKNQAVLRKTQEQAMTLEQQISELEREIKNKEEQVEYQKKILVGLMRSYYENYQQGTLNIVLLNQDFSEVLGQDDYVQQSSFRVKDALVSIQDARSDLEKRQTELKSKKQESLNLKDQLEDRKVELQDTENQKVSLLTQTQGEEAKYQQLLARVESQKLELFNFSDAGNLDEVSASVKNYPQPKDHLASTSWYFSQKDPAWGNKTIGNSNSLMKDYGCAITSVAMVFKKYGAGINPGSLAKQKIYYYDLIKWPGSWPPDIELVSSIGHRNINWKTVDSELAAGHLIIVYIKKINGRGGHYVVVHNKDSKDYIVHDPYFGPNLYLGTSKALVGKIGTDSKTVVDQMIIYK